MGKCGKVQEDGLCEKKRQKKRKNREDKASKKRLSSRPYHHSLVIATRDFESTAHGQDTTKNHALGSKSITNNSVAG